MLDGRHTGTGGGNHFALGGATPADSPFLRRPDLAAQPARLLAQSSRRCRTCSPGMFIGPTSQAPRIDETRTTASTNWKSRSARFPIPAARICPPWLVDRIFRHLLVDVTGNTHRAEFCIDKLYSPDSATGRLGLLEMRGFEMPPHARMSLTQQLLVRALVAWFWQRALHARRRSIGAPSCTIASCCRISSRADFRDVLEDLQPRGLSVRGRMVRAALRIPLPGFRPRRTTCGIELELRQAIEPWYVLGEEPGASGTARYVDSSVERRAGQGQRHDRRPLCRRPAMAGAFRCIRPARTANSSRACAIARGSRPRACIRRFRSIRRWSSICSTPGPAARSAAAPITSRIRAAAATRPFRSTRTKPRRAAPRASSRSAIRRARWRCPPAELNPQFPLTLDLRRRTASFKGGERLLELFCRRRIDMSLACLRCGQQGTIWMSQAGERGDAREDRVRLAISSPIPAFTTNARGRRRDPPALAAVDRFAIRDGTRAASRSRWQEGRRLLHDNGVTYNVYGDPRGTDRPWPLDPVPLVIDEREWAAIEAALRQRATLLNPPGRSLRTAAAAARGSAAARAGLPPSRLPAAVLRRPGAGRTSICIPMPPTWRARPTADGG